MSQLLTPPAGDPRTPEEYTYDMERSGALYQAQPETPDAWDAIVEILLDEAHRPHAPIGTLLTGEAIYGVWDRQGRTGVVGTHIAGTYVTADDDGFLSVYFDNISVEGASRAELAKLRQVLDAAERLFAVARAWAAGEDAPPAPAVTAWPHVCDDQLDARCGQHIWTEYRTGAGDALVEVYVPTARNENPHDVPGVYAFGKDGVSLDRVMHALPSLLAVLNDPRVQAAYREWWPEA